MRRGRSATHGALMKNSLQNLTAKRTTANTREQGQQEKERPEDTYNPDRYKIPKGTGILH